MHRLDVRPQSNHSSVLSTMPPCLSTLTTYTLSEEHLVRALHRVDNAVQQIVHLLLYILPPNLLNRTWFVGELVNYITGRSRSFTETQLTVFIAEDDPFARLVGDRYTFVTNVEQQVQRYIRDYVINRHCLLPDEYEDSFRVHFAPRDQHEEQWRQQTGNVRPVSRHSLLANLKVDLLPVCYRPITLLISLYGLPSSVTLFEPLLNASDISPNLDAYWPLLDAVRLVFPRQTFDHRLDTLRRSKFHLRGCHRCTVERMSSWARAPSTLLCNVHAVEVHAWREYGVTWTALRYDPLALYDADHIYNNNHKAELRDKYNLTVDPNGETTGYRIVRGIYADLFRRRAGDHTYAGSGSEADGEASSSDDPEEPRNLDTDVYFTQLTVLLEEDSWRLYEICNVHHQTNPTQYHEYVQFDYSNGRMSRLRRGRICDHIVSPHCSSILRSTVHPYLPLVFDGAHKSYVPTPLPAPPQPSESPALPLSFLRLATRQTIAFECRVQHLRTVYFYRWLRRVWRPGHSTFGDRMRRAVAHWHHYTYAPRPDSKFVRSLRERFERNLAIHCATSQPTVTLSRKRAYQANESVNYLSKYARVVSSLSSSLSE